VLVIINVVNSIGFSEITILLFCISVVVDDSVVVDSVVVGGSV
jgi:hypothetical protein